MTNAKRRRGERLDGLIQVEVSLGSDEDGKRIKKSFYGKTRKEARAKADTFLKSIGRGIDADKQDLTVREWSQEWMDTYKQNVATSTRRGYQSTLDNHILPAIGHMALADVRHANTQAIINSKAAMSHTTISTCNTVMLQMFREAVRNRIIEVSPAVDLRLPAGSRGSHRALQQWEIDLINRHWRAYHAGRWAMLMLYTGLRRGEMCALRWENINLDAGTLRVEHGVVFNGNAPTVSKTKTRAGVRELPIPRPLANMLAEIRPDNPTGFVCLSSSGRQLTESAVMRNWDAWNNLMQEAANGREAKLIAGRRMDKERIQEAHKDDKAFSVRMHDLRHTFATMLYDAGVDEKTAQYMLGHDDPTITRALYTHLSDTMKSASVDAWLKYNCR